jgi:signal peptidase I
MTDDTPADVGPKPAAARSTADVPEEAPGPAESPAPEPPAEKPAAGAAGPSDNGAQPATEAPKTPEEEPAEPAKAKEKKKQSFWRELPILLAIALVLAIIIKTFLVQAFFIPSSSMEKTLHGCPGCRGDRVLVNKLVYRFHDPRPGDVVVFRGPESWAPEVHIAGPSNIVQRGLRGLGQLVGIAQPNEKDFIKRVIAVGGQTVQCCDPQGRVMVDGKPLDEPYIYTDGDQDPRLAQFGPITVPPDRLWVMGDHRNASADSRVHISDADLGTISVNDVIGKAFVIVWPPSRWNTLGTPPTFKSLGPASGIVNGSAPLLIGLGTVLPIGMVRRVRRRPRRRGWLGSKRSGTRAARPDERRR